MKKLAIFLSLFMLLTALCIPTAAATNATLTAQGASPAQTNYATNPMYASSNVGNPVTAGSGVLNGNIQARYDSKYLYFRIHFSSTNVKELSIWLQETNAEGNGQNSRYRLESNDNGFYESTDAGHWAATIADIKAFTVIYPGDGTMIFDIVLNPQSSTVLKKGTKIPFEISATSTGGLVSCMNCTANSLSDGSGLEWESRPRVFGTLTLGDAMTPDGGTPGYFFDGTGSSNNGPTADALSVAVLASAVALVGAGVVVSKKKHNA